MIKLKEERLKSGMSIQKLSKLVGVSDSAIYNWENGYREPSRKNMAKLANVLNTTVDELFFNPKLHNMC